MVTPSFISHILSLRQIWRKFNNLPFTVTIKINTTITFILIISLQSVGMLKCVGRRIVLWDQPRVRGVMTCVPDHGELQTEDEIVRLYSGCTIGREHRTTVFLSDNNIFYISINW